MQQKPPDYLRDVEPTATNSSDSLRVLQEHGARARDLEMEIAAADEVQKKRKDELNAIYQKSMPDLMLELNLQSITISSAGNAPAIDYEVVPYYSANIAASWDEPRREAGFKFMTKMRAESLIKTEVVVLFPKGGIKLAQALVAKARKIKVPFKDPKKKKTIKQPVKVELSKSIPSGSLKAWLKEYYEKHRKTLSASDLEKIGGSVGRIVKPKERQE